jgi:hypothetical protein
MARGVRTSGRTDGRGAWRQYRLSAENAETVELALFVAERLNEADGIRGPGGRFDAFARVAAEWLVEAMPLLGEADAAEAERLAACGWRCPACGHSGEGVRAYGSRVLCPSCAGV